MSTCPSKDIYSLYADNELPERFKKEFETHLLHCPKCRKVLDTYSALHTKLCKDAETLELNATELEEGYVRLKARLSYTSVVFPNKSFSSLALKLLPAAAALVFAVTLPFAVSAFKTTVLQIVTISSSNVNAVPIQQRGILANDTVQAASLASALGTDYKITLDMPKLTSVNVFQPELQADNVKIYIPLSGVSDMTSLFSPYQTVNVLPVNATLTEASVP